jgi:hypothetical protein
MVVGLLLEIEIIQILVTRNLNLVGNSGAETTYPSAAPEFTPRFFVGKCKRAKRQIMIYKTLHRKLHVPHKKTGGELWCCGRICSFCPTIANQI